MTKQGFSFRYKFLDLYKVKILAFNFRYPPEAEGGVAFSVQALLEEAVLHDNRYSIVCRTPGRYLKEECIRGVHILRIPDHWGEKESIASIREIINQLSPDIIQLHFIKGFFSNLFLSLKQEFRIPLIQYLHGYQYLCVRGTLFKDGITCPSLCQECEGHRKKSQVLSDACDGVVGNSKHTLMRHLEVGLFPNAKSMVIPISIQTPALNSQKQKNKPFCFGYFGRLEPSKGVHWMLEVLKKEEHPIQIGGKGAEQYEQYLTLHFPSPQIEFMSWMSPDQFYSTIDTLIVPSLFEEPFGRVAIEAQSYGVPVIATRLGGLAELVIPGKTGWLINAGDSIGLSKACAEAYDLAPTMKDTCKKQAAQFAPEIIWEKFDNFVTRLL
ncbi:MAG: glycosyltransferase family 4 protein [Proteobacteria bacterium]|nr:glycosyltransferase family 4 protein [Pseudomonadota bacterium]